MGVGYFLLREPRTKKRVEGTIMGWLFYKGTQNQKKGRGYHWAAKELLSPPLSGRPQVTTDPFTRMAANAARVEQIPQTCMFCRHSFAYTELGNPSKNSNSCCFLRN